MNSEIVIREATPEELLSWDEIVTRFDNYRIFHKQSWIRSIEAFSGTKPLHLVFEKEGDVVGCLPGFLVKVGFLRLFCSPREGWQTETMGPVFNPVRISAQEIFATLIPLLEKRYGVHHIEMACRDLNQEVMKDLGFRGKSIFTQRVKLFPHDEDQTMKNMKSNGRQNLRKASKLGLFAIIESEEFFVDEFYHQIKEVFTHRGFAVPFNRNRVVQCFRHMKESGNLLAISVRMPDGTRAATGLFLIEGQELILWEYAHRRDYRWYCPSELLTWRAIQQGVEAGCTTFDMAGGGQFKKKFGAVPDESEYRWIRSRYKWLAWLRNRAKETYRWQQSLRGRIAQRGRPAFKS